MNRQTQSNPQVQSGGRSHVFQLHAGESTVVCVP